MLAERVILFPSSVMAGRFLISRSLSSIEAWRRTNLPIFETRLVGGIDNDASRCSRRAAHGAPVLILWLASFKPTTAGTCRERAMMAVWEVLLPTSVAKPRMILRSSSATSDGDKSSLTTMHGSLQILQVLLMAVPQQIGHDAGSDIAHVGGAFAQISVVNRAESRGVFIGEFLEGGFNVDFVAHRPGR